MNYWIKRLYINILKQERKISKLIIAPNGTIYPIGAQLVGDMTIQEWIDKLQDNK